MRPAFSSPPFLNYKPRANLTVRPELRRDSFDGEGTQPFDDTRSDDQFLAGIDVIYL